MLFEEKFDRIYKEKRICYISCSIFYFGRAVLKIGYVFRTAPFSIQNPIQIEIKDSILVKTGHYLLTQRGL